MDLTALGDFVKVVGVPAAIAFYVLGRLDRRLGELVQEIRTWNRHVVDLLGKLGAAQRHQDARS